MLVIKGCFLSQAGFTHLSGLCIQVREVLTHPRLGTILHSREYILVNGTPNDPFLVT